VVRCRVTDDPDKDELTPVETPVAKRASGQHTIGLVPCPCCKGRKIACDLCVGVRMVGVDNAIAWKVAHADTDPPPTPKNDR